MSAYSAGRRLARQLGHTPMNAVVPESSPGTGTAARTIDSPDLGDVTVIRRGDGRIRVAAREFGVGTSTVAFDVASIDELITALQGARDAEAAAYETAHAVYAEDGE